MTDDRDKGGRERGMDHVLYGSSPPTPAASSAGASSPEIPVNMTSVDWCGLGQGQKGGCLSRSSPQLPWASATSTSTAGGSSPGSSRLLCRPWDRGDLLKRLSTFKSSKWLTAPKVFGPLACARRGWLSVDGDLITCEACGVRLNFPISSSWSQDQVDVAAEAYGTQLGTGHKTFCPWKGNACAESLVQFPPSVVSALIGGFDDRCEALLQFSCLPVISGSAIDQMKITRGSEIDRLLANPPTSFSRETSKDGSAMKHGSIDTANNPYYEAQRLISLCGWEPRFLPHVVDCEEHSGYSTRKAQSVKRGEGSSHRMQEPNILLASHVARLDQRISVQNVTTISDSKCDRASAVLDCTLCGASVRLWSYTMAARPSALMPSGLVELPEPPQKYTEALMHGVSAASGVEGWHAIETPLKEKDIREKAGDATAIDEQKFSSHSGALDLNLTIAGGPTPTILGSLAEPVIDSLQFLGQPEGSEIGGRAASYESFGPGFRGHRMDDGGSTVDRPQSRMHRVDSFEGTVVDLDGDEVDDGEVGGKTSYVGESLKRKCRGENAAADQFSYGLAMTEPGCGDFPPTEGDVEVDNIDWLKKNRREAILQELYERRILLAQPAGNSVYSSSVIAVDTSYSKQENSMESVENLPQDSDTQGTGFSWEKSERVDNEELNVVEQAQQSTCHQGNVVGEVHHIPSDAGISTSNEGGGDVAIENDVAVFSTAIGMGRGLSVGMSGGSVQMGVSHEAEIRGTDLSVHRPESLANDTELITDVTEFQRQTSESVPDQVLTGQFAPQDIEPINTQGQGESWESEHKDKHGILGDHTADENNDANYFLMQPLAGGKDGHPEAELVEPVIRRAENASANWEGKQLTSRWSREQGMEFDPIHQHHHHCPWVDAYVAAAGSGESNLKTALCGWQATIDALDRFHVQNQAFVAPMESKSAASMHKGNGLAVC